MPNIHLTPPIPANHLHADFMDILSAIRIASNQAYKDQMPMCGRRFDDLIAKLEPLMRDPHPDGTILVLGICKVCHQSQLSQS